MASDFVLGYKDSTLGLKTGVFWAMPE